MADLVAAPLEWWCVGEGRSAPVVAKKAAEEKKLHWASCFEGTISTKLKSRCIVPYVGLKFKVGIENNFSYKLNKNGETYLSPFLLDFGEALNTKTFGVSKEKNLQVCVLRE